MMHLQQYYEFSLTLDTEKFSKLLDRAYDKSKGEYQSYSDNDKYFDYALASKGVTITYHDKSYKKKVKLTVDPHWTLGGDGADRNDIEKSLRKLEAYINDYFGSQYELDDFILTKMGIISDINVHKRENVAAYLKVLQRVGKVKGFSPLSDNWLDDDTSFCLEGNSNGIKFMIYDLEKLAKDQLMESEPKRKKLRAITEKTEGILRVEVWVKASRAIRDFTNETLASEQLAYLYENSEKIFLETFALVIPFGDLYKKSEAVEIIAKKVADRRLRWKMLRLLVLIPEKKSLLLAQKAMNYRRIDVVMDMFAKINLSPVTISKRHKTIYMENLYDYL